MNWQSKIYHKYRLDEPVIKILSDYTGILIKDQFLGHLKKENKSFTVANTIPDILDKLSEKDIVIICNSFDIPSFISNKYDVYIFHFTELPIAGNAKLIANLKTEAALSLLSYIDNERPNISITEKNFHELLNQSTQYERKKILAELHSIIQEELKADLSLEKILSISEKWSRLQYLSYLVDDTSFLILTEKIDNFCNSYFETGQWEEVYYAPSSNPKTVDKIIHKMKHDKADRKALLCFDCMCLPEWLLLKDYLSELNIIFEESTVFTLIPSITAVARSAIYAGTYSIYDKKNPGQYTEERDFQTFFGKDTTVYLREKDFQSGDVLLGYNTVNILFNFFDELSHSTIIQESSKNKFGYYNSVKDYLAKSQLKDIFKELVEQKFTIYICSDHGSTIAKGNGLKIEKYLHDKFAKRGTVIDKDSSILVDYKKITIPFIDDKLVVLPENREMFSNLNHYEINHGGISIDEMLVPFIKARKE